MMHITTALLLIAAVATAGFPYALQYRSAMAQSGTTESVSREVAGWPYPKADDEFAAAQAYNETLAKSGQPVLGEAPDPFASTAGGSKSNEAAASASEADRTYQSLLDTGGGIMGSIRVPKVSIRLPIYHGTSDKALLSGAGHLYGTSLPVGGPSTHSIITGHRGLVEALMFTRLDEVAVGDDMYIEVMGRTLAYKVDRIDVILPSDTSKLRIKQGEDRLTLMTCTPYGVNTHRLLVSGHRVTIPDEAPEPDALNDPRKGIIAGVAAAAIIAIPGIPVSTRRNRRFRVMRHASWRPL